jgi:NitT/TauT family transport system substrate-binding protein
MIVNYNPQALRAEREGKGMVVATTASYEGSMPEGFAMRTDRLRSTPKEDLVKIFKGWAKAVQWSQNSANWQEYAKILNSKTFEGEPPYSDQDLKEMLACVKIHDAATLVARNQENGGQIRFLTDLKQFLKDHGMLKVDFVPSELLSNTAITEAMEQFKAESR